MPVMARCPNRVGSEKKFLEFFFYKKTLSFFVTPPTRPPGPPAQGGAPPAPAAARRRGDPRKRGRPSRAEFRAKKCEKSAKIGVKWGFWGVKSAKNVHFLHIFDKKSKTTGELCRQKNAPQPPLSAVQKPANLYSTKCRFFGPPPPPGGYQCTRVHSRGVFGGPPQNPLPKQRPRARPRRLQHAG